MRMVQNYRDKKLMMQNIMYLAQINENHLSEKFGPP